MDPISASWASQGPRIKGALRIIAASMFMMAGTVKLFAFPMPMPGGSQIQLMSQIGIGGLLEVVGGGLLILGLFTRPVAFILAGEMAVAYFQFHAPRGFWPVVNHGEQAVLYCWIWLYYSATGPGAWSVDALRRRSGEG
jgi:putative oxidoreductase